MIHAPSGLAALLLLTACPGPREPKQEKPTVPAATITDREWALVALGNQPAPGGRGKRSATLRLEAKDSHAAGFAGCNHFRASFTLAADSLRFGPALATKMACADGDDLERSFLAVLPLVTTFEATDSALILKGAGEPLARFRAR